MPDYECTIAYAEDFIKIAMIRLMAARPGRSADPLPRHPASGGVA
jgi:hypothetical protein